ncbi:hypothetical protein QQP08_013573, partial [Theobroma cacao]
MASPTAKIAFRIVIGVLLLLALFYVGRPLYWKISATVHDIRHNKQTVSHRLCMRPRNPWGGFMMNPTRGSVKIANRLQGDCFSRSCDGIFSRLIPQFYTKEVSDYQQHQKNLLCSFIFIKHFKLQDLSTTIGKPYLDSSEQSHIHRFN